MKTFITWSFGAAQPASMAARSTSLSARRSPRQWLWRQLVFLRRAARADGCDITQSFSAARVSGYGVNWSFGAAQPAPMVCDINQSFSGATRASGCDVN